MGVREVARVYESESGCKSLWEWERLQEFIRMREVVRVYESGRGCKSS